MWLVAITNRNRDEVGVGIIGYAVIISSTGGVAPTSFPALATVTAAIVALGATTLPLHLAPCNIKLDSGTSRPHWGHIERLACSIVDNESIDVGGRRWLGRDVCHMVINH